MNSAAITVLAEAGIEGIDAEVALRRIQSELISPSEESRIRIEYLDLTMEDVDPNLHRLSEVVRKLVSAGLGETEASEIFGRRGTPAMIALMRGIDRFEELQKPVTSSLVSPKETKAPVEGRLGHYGPHGGRAPRSSG